MATFRKTFKPANAFADRGKEAEKAVTKDLDRWSKDSQTRSYERLVDTKAAGRTVKAAVADFEFWALTDAPVNGFIEVKQTKHLYRLERDKVPQLPRLRVKARCGAICLVLVWHSETGEWRAISVGWLETHGDKGSWNLSDFPVYPTPGAALSALLPEVFG